MRPRLRRRTRDRAGRDVSAPLADPGSAATAETPAAVPELPGRDGFSDPPRRSWRQRRAEAKTATRERRQRLVRATAVLLLRAAHPLTGALTAGGLTAAAALAGRPGREVGLVAATVLVGQALLGWFNELVDRRRDAGRAPSGKPLGDGHLDPGTVWFAFTCGVLLLVPLAISNGLVAGCFYLASVAIGLLGNVILRRGWFSWATWAASYALYPAFLSYGGWGGQVTGDAPEPAMVAIAGLLGIGVHVLCALPGLVADHEDGDRHLALRIALRIGATRLLLVALAWTGAALIGLVAVGDAVGLSR